MKITLDSIFNVDRRIVFIFVFLSLLIPLLWPYAMPCKPSRDVLDMYHAIESAAEADKPVFLSFEWDPTGAAEHEPMARAVVRHLFARNGKAVVMCKSGGQLGEAMHIQLLEDCAQEYGKTYGEDWVYLPFKLGSTNLVINLGQSLQSAWPKDYRNTDLSKIPLTRNINRLADFDYVMVLCASLTTVVDWITYGQSPYNLKMGFGVLGNTTPDVSNYVQSGQVKGLLGGLIGAAQYEQLLVNNGIGEMRRFSAADIVRSQTPSLCSKLIEGKSPVAQAVFASLPDDVQEAVRNTARRRLDKLSPDHKRTITVALNELISPAPPVPGTQPDASAATQPDVIPASEVDAMEVKIHGGASIAAADLLRVKRRAYIERQFPKELVKATAPGRAMRWMTPQSIAHVVLIVAIIFGNICYFIERAQRNKALRGG